MEISTDPALTISARTAVLAIEFSPFEWSSSLLAVAHSSSIAVYSVKFKEDNSSSSTECQQLWECHVTNEPSALAWSPAATLHSLPKCLQLMLATTSNAVYQLSTNIEEEHTMLEMVRHNDNINGIAYNGDSGELWGASTGDDLVTNVWDCQTRKILAKFLLSSPGMNVKFHPEDPDILLVGERNGTLRIYSVGGNCAKLSLRNPAPLLDVDWSLSDPSLLAAAGPNGITIWNLSDTQPSRKRIKVGGGENVTLVALCRSGYSIAATVSIPNTVRIISTNTNKIPVSSNLKAVSDITWHLQHPYLAAASDSKILMWKNDNV